MESLTRKKIVFDNISITGFENEYVFSQIVDTKNFYETETLNKWLPFIKDSKYIIDVGANLGNHTVFFSKKCSVKKLLAIEPYPDNFSLLQQNVADNRLSAVICVNEAASDKAGYAVFGNTAQDNLGAVSVTVGANKIDGSVKVTTLDSLIQKYKIIPDFVKIDVEGSELSVLRGMSSVLKKHKPKLWLEVTQETVEDVIDILSKSGYLLVDASAFNMFFMHKSNNITPKSVSLLAVKYLKATADSWSYRKWSKNDSIKAKQFEAQLIQTKNLLEKITQAEKDLADKLRAEISKLQENIKGQKAELIKLESDLKTKIEQISDLITEQEKSSLQRIKLEDDLKRIKLSSSKQISELQSELYTTKNEKAKLLGELTDIKARKLYKVMRGWWKTASDGRYYSKKMLYSAGFFLHKKTERNFKLNSALRRINNRLGIIKNYKEALGIVMNDKVKKTSLVNGMKNTGLATTVRPLKKIRVACIVDEFTYNSFKFECDFIEIKPDNWRQVMDATAPDLFFCESAWSGVDSKLRPWKGQIYCSTNFKRENRVVLFEILAYCKEKKIPTVFWNKEDPTYFLDTVHNFTDTATKFDYIFTTAEECVAGYKDMVKHERVYPLMFAAQPRLFNPIEKYDRTDEIIFAGSWYKQHPERSREMEEIFDAIIKSGNKLKIFDRYSADTDPNHVFPDKYKQYIHPALSYEALDQAYKGSKYALNINTVTDSSTMFARRVFELMASNTHVLSNYSKGIVELFGNNITITSKGSFSLRNVEAKRAWCLNEVLKNHTYKNRLCKILDCVGISYKPSDPTISIYYLVSNKTEIQSILKAINPYVDSVQKIYLLLSRNIPDLEVVELYKKYNSATVEVLSEEYIQKYHSGELKCSTDYFIFADAGFNLELIKKAPLHIQYLESEVACYWEPDLSQSYRIYTGPGLVNTVLPVTRMKDAFSAYTASETIEITKYGIN